MGSQTLNAIRTQLQNQRDRPSKSSFLRSKEVASHLSSLPVPSPYQGEGTGGAVNNKANHHERKKPTVGSPHFPLHFDSSITLADTSTASISMVPGGVNRTK